MKPSVWHIFTVLLGLPWLCLFGMLVIMTFSSPDAGPRLLLLIVSASLSVGGVLGAWWQRRVNRLGIPNAFLPGPIRNFIEERL